MALPQPSHGLLDMPPEILRKIAEKAVELCTDDKVVGTDEDYWTSLELVCKGMHSALRGFKPCEPLVEHLWQPTMVEDMGPQFRGFADYLRFFPRLRRLHFTLQGCDSQALIERALFVVARVCPSLNLLHFCFETCSPYSNAGKRVTFLVPINSLNFLKGLQLQGNVGTSSLSHSRLQVLKLRDIEGHIQLTAIPSLQELTIVGRYCAVGAEAGASADLWELASCQHMVHVDLAYLKLRGMRLPRFASSLEFLRLNTVYGFKPFKQMLLTRLSTLCVKKASIPNVWSLLHSDSGSLHSSNIKSLEGVGHEDQELPDLSRHTLLECVSLQGLRGPWATTSLEMLSHLTELRLMELGGLSELPPMHHLTALRRLEISSCQALRNLPPLERLSRLERLRISACGALSALPALVGLTCLQDLELSSLDSLTALPDLTDLASLSTLILERLKHVNHLPVLRFCTSLKCLRLAELDLIQNLSGVLPPFLEKVELKDCPNLQLPAACMLSLQDLHLR